MLYVKSGEKHLVILGPLSLEQLRTGQSVTCPDTDVELRYSPDVVWLGHAVSAASDAGILNDEVLNALHEGSMQRTPVLSPPLDEHKQIIRDENAAS